MSVVIIGAGHGGATVAIELRKTGYEGAITMVGDEPVIPYQRPPLSKDWLSGDTSFERIALRPADWYAQNEIALLLNSRALEIDRPAHRLALADGRELPFEQLIIATGARARRLSLPGSELAGVLALRNTEDADRLKGALRTAGRIAIIGAGYVGLETAASARALGVHVTIIEREALVLSRVACPYMSDYVATVHKQHGVEFALGAELERFLGDRQVRGVELKDGTVIHCDLAIVGIGAIANDDLARSCGLQCHDGILVDEQSRTSDPAIFAIGDVTKRLLARYQRQVRLESVHNVVEQAKQAAAAICNLPAPPVELPWFWSDQYDLKIQIAGLAFDCDELIVRRPAGSQRLSLFHLKADRVEALEAINAPGEFLFAKTLIAQRVPIDREKLADPSIPLREVARNSK
jgi:3-phenylpropionate/trans-cinnamate dioxygenase ferredoxin reductase subunit